MNTSENNTIELSPDLSGEVGEVLSEMGRAGLFYGRKKSKTHPKMKVFIHSLRNGIHIIDGMCILSALKEAVEFLKSIMQIKDNIILIVGTQPSAKSTVLDFSKKYKLPYVTERWIGGTLTNFKVISKRIEHFKKLKDDDAAGRLEKYTKKERLQFQREIEKMNTMFGGIQDMKGLPSAIIIVDTSPHQIALNEAKRIGIPCIALLNTDGNPDEVTLAIPCNTNSKESINWVFKYLSDAFQ